MARLTLDDEFFDKPRRCRERHYLCLHCQQELCESCQDFARCKKLLHTLQPLPSYHESEAILKRCPRLVAHLIAESLGYATPTNAARIIADAHQGRENWCEWIYSCYGRDPRKALKDAITRRKHHTGYMAEYQLARKCVEAERAGHGPQLASWF